MSDERIKELEQIMESYRLQNDREGFIQEMIATHPDMEIKKNFLAWIEEGLLRVKFEPEFLNDVLARTGLWTAEGGELRPQIGFSDSFFASSPQMPWIALAHEYSHVKEVLEGISNLSWYTEGATEQNTIKLFADEVRAYILECNFAKEIDSISLHRPCEIYHGNEGLDGLELWILEETIIEDPRHAPYADAVKAAMKGKG